MNNSEAIAIQAFITISKNPVLLRRAMFGKYVGKTFEEIKVADSGYLQWMSSLADKDEDFPIHSQLLSGESLILRAISCQTHRQPHFAIL